VPLIGVHLIGVHLIGVHLTSVHLIGVYLMGMYPKGVSIPGVRRLANRGVTINKGGGATYIRTQFPWAKPVDK
jgi:hypothetical protein